MQLPLNLNSRQTYELIHQDETSSVEYFPHFLENSKSLFSLLKKELNWRQDKISLYGKTHDVPRLQAWYAENDRSYTYSGIQMNSSVFSSNLISVKQKIEEKLSVKFNSVLCNLYREGRDYVAWHRDNEPELGLNPYIGSLSLGESRVFSFRKLKSKDRTDLLLNCGDLLFMSGDFQHRYEHCLKKTSKSVGERINLTFRKIIY